MFRSSFLVIGAEWTCAQALRILSDVRYAVVLRSDVDLLYAFERTAIEDELAADPDVRVVDALKLATRTPTPTAYADGVRPAELAVVIDRGRIAGLHVPENTGILEVYIPRGDGLGASQRDFTAALAGKIELGKKTNLLVSIGALGQHVDGAATIAIASGTSIDLVVDATGSIGLVSEPEQKVTVEDVEIEHRFQLEARALGPGRVVVRAYDGSRRIAMVTATIDVVESAVADAPVVERRAQIQSESPPDLEIEITEDRERYQYRVTLTGGQSALGLNRKRFTIQLDSDVDAFFTRVFADIEQIMRSPKSPDAKRRDLAQQGLYLFERIMPPDLRAQLWTVRDRICTVRIQSEEPWVPWELCMLSGPDANGVTIDDQFIAERYHVTRWFLGVPEVRTLACTTIGLVVPADSGLAAARGEKETVEELGVDGRTVTKIECEPVVLRDQLASSRYDVLHFAGHGAHQADDADRSSIRLEGGERFYPRDLAGRVGNFGRRNPLVVLNACEVGRSGMTLGAVSGWPQAFVRGGAAAFIGPWWKINDQSAADFTGELYRALLEGLSFGEAVNRSRLKIRDAGDPTWLAYTAYGHPDARIPAKAPGG